MKHTSFANYRNWVLVNYSIGTGNRLKSVVNIKIGDLNLDESCLILRKNKDKKGQIVPLHSYLVEMLREYLTFRKGNVDDYLFCASDGNQFTRQGISYVIKIYNGSRGVNKRLFMPLDILSLKRV